MYNYLLDLEKLPMSERADQYKKDVKSGVFTDTHPGLDFEYFICWLVGDQGKKNLGDFFNLLELMHDENLV